MTLPALAHSAGLQPVQQAVDEAGSERVAGADLVDDRRRSRRRHLDAVDDRASRADADHRGDRDLAVRPEELGLALAAEVPVDVLQNRLLPSGRGLGRVRERGAEVGVEDDRRASLLRPPRDVEDELAGALRDRHRDPGQMDDLHAVERLVRHVADLQSRGGRAGAAVGDVRPPARAPLAEEAGWRVVALHPARLDAFARDGGEDQVAERIAAEPRDPRDVDAEPRQGDREVGLGAREAQRQRHAEPQLAVLQRVEQRHRLAEREDRHVRS